MVAQDDVTSVKNSEKALAEQLLFGRFVDCGHRVFNSARQEVTDRQRAALKEEGLTVRDEKEAYVKTRRPKGSVPRYMFIRKPRRPSALERVLLRRHRGRFPI